MISPWKFFELKEFKCRCCGLSPMHEHFMNRLDALRAACDFPFRVTSGYRCPEHNRKVSSTGLTGPHTTGRAADIAVDGRLAFKLMQLAMSMGFTGIGVQQKGLVRFIHLDDLEGNETRPRPTIWSY